MEIIWRVSVGTRKRENGGKGAGIKKYIGRYKVDRGMLRTV